MRLYDYTVTGTHEIKSELKWSELSIFGDNIFHLHKSFDQISQK